ncbi:hypothetical protein N7540_005995 [Penicillium herquei]|nr:hypothetical protein N7540_005995 [Penicillium herquei]
MWALPYNALRLFHVILNDRDQLHAHWPSDFNSKGVIDYRRQPKGPPMVIMKDGVAWIPVYGVTTHWRPWADKAHKEADFWLSLLIPSKAMMAASMSYRFDDFTTSEKGHFRWPNQDGNYFFYSAEAKGLVQLSDVRMADHKLNFPANRVHLDCSTPCYDGFGIDTYYQPLIDDSPDGDKAPDPPTRVKPATPPSSSPARPATPATQAPVISLLDDSDLAVVDDQSFDQYVWKQAKITMIYHTMDV